MAPILAESATAYQGWWHPRMFVLGQGTQPKNVDAVVPRGKMVVVTGPSGSGKSSLAFHVIFSKVSVVLSIA